MGMALSIEMPDDVELALREAGYGPERVAAEARHSLAASLFAAGVLSLGKAARLAGLGLWEFIPYLGARGIAIADYDGAEIRRELEAAQWAAQAKPR